jgi:hypothetical protein
LYFDITVRGTDGDAGKSTQFDVAIRRLDTDIATVSASFDAIDPVLVGQLDATFETIAAVKV